MKRYHYGLLLLAMFALISYIGPSEARTTTWTDADGAKHYGG